MIKNILLVLPIVAIIGSISMIYMTIKEKKNWSTNKNAPVDEIEARTANRGTLVSIISSIILSVVGGIMASLRVPENMIVTNYGFLLGPVIGYMLDIGIGTDNGYSKIKNIKEWFVYIFSSLVTGNFLRYIVTVLLDLFISDPIQDVIKKTILPVKEELSNGGAYSQVIASNIPSILQSIVGFITFQAYTNQTRFNWAYPSENLPIEKRMSKYIITLITSLAGCLYLVHNIQSKVLGTKVIYVLFAISLLYIMNVLELSEAPTKQIKKKNKNKKLNFFIGIILFSLFVLYGLVLPLANAGNENA